MVAIRRGSKTEESLATGKSNEITKPLLASPLRCSLKDQKKVLLEYDRMDR